jgi:hypothetical protein
VLNLSWFSDRPSCDHAAKDDDTTRPALHGPEINSHASRNPLLPGWPHRWHLPLRPVLIQRAYQHRSKARVMFAYHQASGINASENSSCAPPAIALFAWTVPMYNSTMILTSDNPKPDPLEMQILEGSAQ